MQLLQKGGGLGVAVAYLALALANAPHLEEHTQAAKHGKLIPYANLAQTKEATAKEPRRPVRVRKDHPKMLLKFRNLQSQKSRELTEFYGKIIIGTRVAYWLAFASDCMVLECPILSIVSWMALC